MLKTECRKQFGNDWGKEMTVFRIDSCYGIFR